MAITFRFKSRLFGIVVDVRKGKNKGYRWIGLMILTRLLRMEKLRGRKVKTNTNMKSANVEMTKYQRLNIERERKREKGICWRDFLFLWSLHFSQSLSLPSNRFKDKHQVSFSPTTDQLTTIIVDLKRDIFCSI